MSFQITILKVLAGQPEGRATHAELTRQVAIFISSGSDWTDRMRRLAARAPGLSIFGSHLVLHSSTGWQITDAGREFLLSLEKPTSQSEHVLTPTVAADAAAKLADEEMPSEDEQTTATVRASSPSRLMRLIGTTRRRPRRPVADGKRRSS